MHGPTGPAPGIIVWGGIRFHRPTPLVRNAGTLNSQRYISEVFESVVHLYIQCLQIELLSWPACSPDLSPIEKEWSMFAQRLAQNTPSAAIADQFWQYVEAAWTAVPQGHIQSLLDPMPRHVAAVMASNGSCTNY
ncbi:transposable element Tcb1 transposase [Trichonephila clavipes]|nr:transposable element Tcb1 transposase [Trichonephila clavipes]